MENQLFQRNFAEKFKGRAVKALGAVSIAAALAACGGESKNEKSVPVSPTIDNGNTSVTVKTPFPTAENEGPIITVDNFEPFKPVEGVSQEQTLLDFTNLYLKSDKAINQVTTFEDFEDVTAGSRVVRSNQGIQSGEAIIFPTIAYGKDGKYWGGSVAVIVNSPKADMNTLVGIYSAYFDTRTSGGKDSEFKIVEITGGRRLERVIDNKDGSFDSEVIRYKANGSGGYEVLVAECNTQPDNPRYPKYPGVPKSCFQ